MADRVNENSLTMTVSAIVQAEKLGSDLASILHELAKESRDRRWMRAEEKAAQLPIKMIIPMALFMIPSLYLMIFGPVIAQFVEQVVLLLLLSAFVGALLFGAAGLPAVVAEWWYGSVEPEADGPPPLAVPAGSSSSFPRASARPSESTAPSPRAGDSSPRRVGVERLRGHRCAHRYAPGSLHARPAGRAARTRAAAP